MTQPFFLQKLSHGPLDARNSADCQQETTSMTVRRALYEAMAETMRQDESVFLMGEEVAQYQGAYKISQGLLDEFGPQRVIDTPISEHGFAGLATGAAFAGLRPIVEFMSFNFSLQAIDHVLNSAAKTLYMSGGLLGCPIVFRGPNGAAARVAAQHSQCFASWYAHCPGLKVVAPYDAASTKALLMGAILDPNPVIFLENEILYGKTFQVPTNLPPAPIEGAIVRRVGTDITLVAFSLMVDLCLQAADLLAQEGIHAEVIDLCVLRPWDGETVITSVQKTGRILAVEEGWSLCGIGAEIIAHVNEHAFDALDAPPMRIAGADVPLPYAQNLERAALPCLKDILEAARALCS
jgi:pyruvate dehydrogenase E1 component beta subunit